MISTMDTNDVDLLKAIHIIDKNVEARIGKLETKIDDSINGRFKDNERRISNLEQNQSRITWAIVTAVIMSVLSLVII